MKAQKPITLRKELERDLIDQARRILSLRGFFCIRNNTMTLLAGTKAITNPNRGMPDFQCIKAGRSLWLEFKRPGWKPPKPYDKNGLPNGHAFQTNWILNLRQAGCMAEFITSLPELDAAINRFEREILNDRPSGDSGSNPGGTLCG